MLVRTSATEPGWIDASGESSAPRWPMLAWLACMLAGLSGCHSLDVKEGLAPYAIVVDSEGRPRVPDNVRARLTVDVDPQSIERVRKMRDPRGLMSEADFDAMPAAHYDMPAGPEDYFNHLQGMFENIRKQGKKRIAIVIHGGLVSRRASAEMVEVLYGPMLGGDTYPIFINWESSLWSSYGSHLFSIRQGEQHPRRGWMLAGPYFVGDLGKAMARAPIVWTQMITNDVRALNVNDEGWRPDLIPPQNNARALSSRLNLRGSPANSPISDVGFGFGEKLKSRSLYVLTFIPKLTISPAIDTFGSSAWETMLRRTKNAFRPPAEFDVEPFRKPVPLAGKLDENLDSGATGPVPVFMVALAEFLSREARAGRHYQLDLIAHSMGAFIANQMLDYDLSEELRLNFHNIVYMAAACSVREMDLHVIPYLKAASPDGQLRSSRDQNCDHGGGASCDADRTRFYNLSLHHVAEARERWSSWTLGIDLPPRGSLLVWIDSFLAHPSTIPDRTLGSWENIRRATHLIPKDVRGQVHLKTFGVGSTNGGHPEKHGQFNDANMKFWCPEFWRVN